ncbi:MAG: hypothetical protein AB4206_07210 [Xenococcaceae cyanobacterium]
MSRLTRDTGHLPLLVRYPVRLLPTRGELVRWAGFQGAVGGRDSPASALYKPRRLEATNEPEGGRTASASKPKTLYFPSKRTAIVTFDCYVSL